MAPAWTERWRVVAPPGAVRVDVGRRGRFGAPLPALAGPPLVLCAAGPLAKGRIRRAARRAGVAINRQYLALPSAGSPAFLVEDSSAAIDYFRTRILTPPPGTARGVAAVDLAIRLVRRAPRRLLSGLAPGRVAVGSQP
jgi:hypothetical protein